MKVPAGWYGCFTDPSDPESPPSRPSRSRPSRPLSETLPRSHLNPMLITVSRQFGAGGSEVAERVAAALEWRLVDNELVEQVARRADLTAEEVARREERVPTFTERLARTLAAGTPELFPLVGEGRVVPRCQEHELVKFTEAVVAEIAAEGRVVVVGRAAP